MAHRSRIDLAAREIIGGKVMVNNAARNIVKGRTLVDNTYRDIFFGIPIGTLDVGETVLMDIDGKETEFLIVNQGNPDGSIYDASCDGTWLLAKNILEEKVIEPVSDMYYHGSNIHEYLNGDFLGLLDAGLQDTIIQAKIPDRTHDDDVLEKENGLSVKVFVLSLSELNFGERPSVGSTLSYFDKGVSTFQPNEHLIATLDGVAENWIVRSYSITGSHYISIDTKGVFGNHDSERTVGIRPAMIVPFETRVTNTRHKIMG